VSQLPPIQYGPPPGNPYQTPSPQGGMGGGPANIKTYMVESILVTLFCNLLFGIIAIVNASKVSSLLAQGNVAGAMEASKKAKFWCIVALVIGIVGTVLTVGLAIVSAVVGASQQ